MIESQFDEVQKRMVEQAAVLELERLRRIDDEKKYEESKRMFELERENFVKERTRLEEASKRLN